MSLIIRQDTARDIRILTAAIQAHNPRSAAKFAVALDRAIRRLERFPLSGSELGLSADGSATFRFATVKAFRHIVVIYLPLPDGVDVVRVVDGRRDLGAIIASITP